MDTDMDRDYSESAYAATSNSNLSKETRKPRGRNCKSKSCHGGRKKDKKGAKRQHEKNTCPHSTTPNSIAYPRINACGTRNIRGIDSSPYATN